MEFPRSSIVEPRALGVLPGSFHPPTRAHLALARAALERVNQVLFVLPREFPHKQYDQVGIADRVSLLREATAGEPRFHVALSEGGLFIDIARECRKAAPHAELLFLCGRDAAERIVNWNYGAAGAIAAMLEEFSLLVADREGRYQPPLELAHRIRALDVEDDLSGISSSEVRRRIAQGEPWEHLVPEEITESVRRIYC